MEVSPLFIRRYQSRVGSGVATPWNAKTAFDKDKQSAAPCFSGIAPRR
jgi:hypothetical protein